MFSEQQIFATIASPNAAAVGVSGPARFQIEHMVEKLEAAHRAHNTPTAELGRIVK
jgi:hypothetical protein